MTSPELPTGTGAAPRSIRLVTALLLVGTFALGSATGVGLTLWARHDLGHGHRPGPPPFGPLPLHELDLTREQHEKADAIFERHRAELDAILEEGYPKVRRVNEQIEREVREILTAEQRQRLDQLEAQRPPPRHGHFPPGPPDGPGGPGGPPAGPPREPPR